MNFQKVQKTGSTGGIAGLLKGKHQTTARPGAVDSETIKMAAAQIGDQDWDRCAAALAKMQREGK